VPRAELLWDPVSVLRPELLDVVRRAGRLCLSVEDPGWDNARGYLFEESRATLYFPVSRKYQPAQPEGFRVLIWSRPRVIVTGDLHPATSEEDVRIQLFLAEEKGMEPEKARYMLVDQRTNKPRATRHKLLIRNLSLAPT
jgi:hypothetical protein